MAQRNKGSFGSFKSVVQMLREDLPPAFPVTVNRCKVSSEIAGDCAKKGERFIIRISSGLEEDAAILILMHEWAHALAWTFERAGVRDHGPEWGVAYSRVYRCWLAGK